MTPAVCGQCDKSDAWDLDEYIERECALGDRVVYSRRFRCGCKYGKEARSRALYVTKDGQIGDGDADKFPVCACPGGRCGRPGCLECSMRDEPPAAALTRAKVDAAALAVRDRDAEQEDDLPQPAVPAVAAVELVHSAIDEGLERWIVRAHLSGLSPRWVYSRAWIGVPPLTFQAFLSVYVSVVISYQRAGRVDLGVPLPGPLAETGRVLAEARTGLAELLAEQRAERAAAHAELQAAEQHLADFNAEWDGSTAGAVERAPLVEAQAAAATKLGALVKRHELAAPKLAAALATVAKAQLDQRRQELEETERLIKWTALHDAELEE